MSRNPVPELETYCQDSLTITWFTSRSLSPWSRSCFLFQFSSVSSRSSCHKWLCIGTIHSAKRVPFRKSHRNYSGHTSLSPLTMRPLRGCLSHHVAHWVEGGGKTRLREVGENRNPNSHAKGESSANLTSCSWSHSSAARNMALKF